MALRDHSIPNETVYNKLSDFGDGERIKIFGCGINEGGKFGAQAFFVADDGLRISLPVRYVDYISAIMSDEDAYREICSGTCTIIKGSRACDNGTTTSTFTFV